VIDIERVRFAGELEAYETFERKDRGDMLRFQLHKPDGASDRRAILSRAVLLTEAMAPELYAAAHEALKALGVEDRIELFQRDGVAPNARLALSGAPIGIEFIGDYVDRFDHATLVAIFGHEIGHAIAHSGHAKYRWALHTCQGGDRPWRRAYATAAEVTADRFGLLACRDLHAALRLEMQSVTGRVSGKIRFDTEAYLDHCKSFVEETAKHGTRPASSTHPDHYVRGYAEWLFWESDLFRELAGVGPGTRKLADIDALLRPLVGLPLSAKPATRDFVHRLKGTGAVTTDLAASFQEHVRRMKKKK
jgi:hypothetical protein